MTDTGRRVFELRVTTLNPRPPLFTFSDITLQNISNRWMNCHKDKSQSFSAFNPAISQKTKVNRSPLSIQLRFDESTVLLFQSSNQSKDKSPSFSSFNPAICQTVNHLRSRGQGPWPVNSHWPYHITCSCKVRYCQFHWIFFSLQKQSLSPFKDCPASWGLMKISNSAEFFLFDSNLPIKSVKVYVDMGTWGLKE